jgi:hypothetical protein
VTDSSSADPSAIRFPAVHTGDSNYLRGDILPIDTNEEERYVPVVAAGPGGCADS